MLEMKYTVMEMKNGFVGFASRWDMCEGKKNQ